jgi:hypothetical protein
MANGRVVLNDESPGVRRQSFNWLRVLGTAELPQIDEHVCYQLHAIVPLLDALEQQQQPFEFILPREGPLYA